VEAEKNRPVVLITGGSGSLGTALSFRLVDDGYRVRTLSRSEAGRAKLLKAIDKEPYKSNISVLAGDVRDPNRLDLALRGVDTVIHAAALKRIDLCESDPIETVEVNVNGTRNVIQAILESGVRRAILISTDKACSPSTHYGATKLCAERVWLSANAYSRGEKPLFIALRYGNVFGSAGSVIHAFKEQERGGLLSITDERSTRFNITMAQAVSLVRSAMDDGQAGDLFIPKLPSYRLLDLVHAYCDEHLFGIKSYVASGLRPAEKLHESLISLDESESISAETPGGYILHPNKAQHGGKRFTYTSENGPFLGMDELKELIRAV